MKNRDTTVSLFSSGVLDCLQLAMISLIPRSDILSNCSSLLSVFMTLESITMGTGFGGITDIETGPDGFLYVLTFNQESEGEGKIYKILPSGSPNV